MARGLAFRFHEVAEASREGDEACDEENDAGDHRHNRERAEPAGEEDEEDRGDKQEHEARRTEPETPSPPGDHVGIAWAHAWASPRCLKGFGEGSRTGRNLYVRRPRRRGRARETRPPVDPRCGTGPRRAPRARR